MKHERDVDYRMDVDGFFSTIQVFLKGLVIDFYKSDNQIDLLIKSSFRNFDRFQWLYRIRFSISHTGKGSKITMVCDLGRFKFAIFSMILVSIIFSILAGVLAETFLATLFIIGGSSLMVLIFSLAVYFSIDWNANLI